MQSLTVGSTTGISMVEELRREGARSQDQGQAFTWEHLQLEPDGPEDQSRDAEPYGAFP